jgi:hypothetical protein
MEQQACPHTTWHFEEERSYGVLYVWKRCDDCGTEFDSKRLEND